MHQILKSQGWKTEGLDSSNPWTHKTGRAELIQQVIQTADPGFAEQLKQGQMGHPSMDLIAAEASGMRFSQLPDYLKSEWAERNPGKMQEIRENEYQRQLSALDTAAEQMGRKRMGDKRYEAEVAANNQREADLKVKAEQSADFEKRMANQRQQFANHNPRIV